MSDQMTLGLDDHSRDARPRSHKPEYVFFGADAGGRNDEIAEVRRRLIRQNRIFASKVAAERFHISLTGLGNFAHIPSKVPYGAKLAAQKISLPAFEAVLDRAVSFPETRPGKRATVLLARGHWLQALGDSLSREVLGLNLKAGVLTTPHLTLFYSQMAIPETEIEPIRLWIDRFYLIHSERGLGHYHVLGHWPLGDAGVTGAGSPLAFGAAAA